MKKITFCILAVLSVTSSFAALSGEEITNRLGNSSKLISLTDIEASEVHGKIVAEGILSAQEEAKIIAQLKANDAETLLKLQTMNSIVTDQRTSRSANESAEQSILKYLEVLSMIGVPQVVIDKQIENLIRQQDMAATEADKLSVQQTIAQQLVNLLTDLNNQIQN